MHERKVKRRILRKVESATLAVVVAGGLSGGGYALARAFGSGSREPTPLLATGEGRIAFVRALDGHAQIFVMNGDGSDPVEITNGPADDTAPAWSPDASMIAFVRTQGDGQEIYLMNSDGTAPSRVTDGADPAWSPDGVRLAFARNVVGTDSTVGRLLTSSPDGANGLQIAQVDQPVDHPTWSPDGGRIAFAEQWVLPQRGCIDGDCFDGTGVGIYVVGSDGGPVGTVGGSMTGARQPSWSPSGTLIVFSEAAPLPVPCPSPPPGGTLPPACHPPQPQLALMSPDGSATRLTDLPEGANHPAWSPDGSQILFDSGGDIYVIDVGGSNLRQLTSGPAIDSDPSWQPTAPASSAPATSEPPSPSESPSPSTSPSAETSPSPSTDPCAGQPVSAYQSHVTGNYDGNGVEDLAVVDRTCQVVNGAPSFTWILTLSWDGGAGGAVLLPDCGEACRALAAGDLNGDGTDEFVLQVDEGASTQFVEIYELPATEAFGHHAATVLEPGAPGYLPGEPARFAIGGSVTHTDLVTCDTVGGQAEVFATSAVLGQDQAQYDVHETTFVFDPASDAPYGALSVVSTRDYTVPFDPSQPTEIPAPGTPCWTVEG